MTDLLQKEQIEDIYNKIISFDRNYQSRKYYMDDWLIDTLLLAEYGLMHPKSKKGAYAIRVIDLNILNLRLLNAISEKLGNFLKNYEKNSYACTIVAYQLLQKDSKEDYLKALEYLEKATSGEINNVINPIALVLYGIVYSGQKNSDHIKNALKCFLQAINLGSAQGIYHMSLLLVDLRQKYYKQDGSWNRNKILPDYLKNYVNKYKDYNIVSYKKSKSLMREASKLGHHKATNTLAGYYLEGINGCPKSVDKAKKYFRSVIDKVESEKIFNNSKEAQIANAKLAVIYSDEKYESLNLKKALRFAREANRKYHTEQNSIEGTQVLAKLLEENKIGIDNLLIVHKKILENFYEKIIGHYQNLSEEANKFYERNKALEYLDIVNDTQQKIKNLGIVSVEGSNPLNSYHENQIRSKLDSSIEKLKIK